MPEMTIEDIMTRIAQIQSEHPNLEDKWFEGTYELIKDQPVTLLSELVGEDEVMGLIKGYFGKKSRKQCEVWAFHPRHYTALLRRDDEYKLC